MEALHTDDVTLDGPMRFGRVLDGAGGGIKIGSAAARNWQPCSPGEVLWLHVDRTIAGVQAWLERLGIPEPTAEMLVSNETRPRTFAEAGALATTLRGVNYNPGEAPEDMISFQIWSDGKRVISPRRYLEGINISKQSALVLQDDIRARALSRSERTSYLLTIVAAIFLPLGFLTGLLGINVGGMPGVDSEELMVQLCLFYKWRWL